MGGPPPQEQIDATLEWVTSVFRGYYAQAPPEPPARFGRREFGFLWNGKKFFLRHVGFPGREAFQDFLVREGPHHAYYSTAYYKTPSASTMKEKEWLGADLIFDLDADHLKDADKLTYAEQLAEVKRQAKKLLHEFLLGDFGFDPEHVRIVFSGGRGYHFHVTDPRVLSLDGAARREIVDYLSPNEQVKPRLIEDWLTERTFDKDDFGRAKKTKVVAKATAPGWTGHLTRAFVSRLEELRSMPPREAEKELRKLEGIGKKTAEDIVAGLTPERIRRIAEDGKLDQFAALIKADFIDGLLPQAINQAEGETDEPVTADVKRLIRLPGSLHGKTGLRVTALTLEEFERFDPLRDAVALSDEPVRIVVSKPVDVPLKGKTLRLEPGEQEAPLYAAVFAVLRRSALRPYTGPVAAPSEQVFTK
jgi:DNA primase small subunit